MLLTTSCSSDMEWKDSNVTAPSGLLLPDDNQSIELVASATASTVFNWGMASGEDGGAPEYEVLFDKAGGDFSNPIYSVASDGNGSLPQATVSHKTLNTVAGLAGAGVGETATVQWTVRAWRGLNSSICSQTRSLTMKRYIAIENLPGALYATGSAIDEAASSLSFASPANGEFEIFIKLKPGTLQLNSSADGSGTAYTISGTKVLENDNAGYTISEAGVYRIAMDFNVASLTIMKKIESMNFFFCEGATEVVLPYIGNGQFQGEVQMDRVVASWGTDERYRFCMYYADGTSNVWGAVSTNDGKPASMTEGDSYFNMYEYPNDGSFDNWAMKWKWSGDFDYKLSTVTCTFNVAQYTHFYKLAN